MFKSFKSNKGVTLFTLVIYIIVLMIVLGLMVSFRSLFYGNIGIIQEGAGYAETFDVFNTQFVEDVKSNTDVVVNKNGSDTQIIFSNGVIYNYHYADRGLYRNSIKIGSNIEKFDVKRKIISLSLNQQQQNLNQTYSIQKIVLNVDMVIGKTNHEAMFSKKLDYTLRYW